MYNQDEGNEYERKMKCDYECFFPGNWFRYRVGGIIISDGKMLFVNSNLGNYYYLIGGGVQIGESSEESIIRELQEEVGLLTHVSYLSAVCENFFTKAIDENEHIMCHTLELYYKVEIEDATYLKTQTDLGEQLVWIPLKEICNYNIKPSIIVKRVEDILNSNRVVHLIDKSDLKDSGNNDL